jgi:hypothetical protein
LRGGYGFIAAKAAVFFPGGAVQQIVLDLGIDALELAQTFEYAQADGHDFRTYSVTGQNKQFEWVRHGALQPRQGASL